jgi:hypothetical protein
LTRGWLCAALLVFGACRSPASVPASNSGPLTAITPSGQSDWPLTFRWSGASAGALVRLRIYDDAERQVFGSEARGTTWEAPRDLNGILSRGTPYQWRVARVDANGEEVDASALTRFSIRAAP